MRIIRENMLPPALEQQILKVEQPQSAGVALASAVIGEYAGRADAPYAWNRPSGDQMAPSFTAPHNETESLPPQAYIKAIQDVWSERSSAARLPWSVLSGRNPESVPAGSPFSVSEQEIITGAVQAYMERKSFARMVGESGIPRNSLLLGIGARLLTELTGFVAAPRILAADAFLQAQTTYGPYDPRTVRTGQLPLPDILSLPPKDRKPYTETILKRAERLCDITARVMPELLLFDPAYPGLHNTRSAILETSDWTQNTKRSVSRPEVAFKLLELYGRRLPGPGEDVIGGNLPLRTFGPEDQPKLPSGIMPELRKLDIMGLRARQALHTTKLSATPEGGQLIEAARRGKEVSLKAMNLKLNHARAKNYLNDYVLAITYALHERVHPNWEGGNFYVPTENIFLAAAVMAKDLLNDRGVLVRSLSFKLRPVNTEQKDQAARLTGRFISRTALMLYAGAVHGDRQKSFRGTSLLIDSPTSATANGMLYTTFVHGKPESDPSRQPFYFE